MEPNSTVVTLREDQKSKQAWDRFAEADAYKYILTTVKDLDPQKFWESGERTVRLELLPFIRKQEVHTGIGMELGCGLGRLVLPMSQYFQQMVGIDIAEGMTQRAASFARQNNIQNAEFIPISGSEDYLKKTQGYAGKIDFIYSLLVFQHIADFAIIDGYLHVIGNLLHDDGIAYLQFDTRNKDVLYHLKVNMPDFLLPRFLKSNIRRVRRSVAEIRGSLKNAGLEIHGEIDPLTSYHRFVLKKAKKPFQL